MTLNSKNRHLQYLQCLQESYASKLYKSLSYGNCPEEKLILNEMLTYIIRVVRRYTPFDSEVTYAYKFTFTRVEENEEVEVEIDIDGVNWTYSGTGSANDIVDFFYSEINDGTTTPEYYAEKDGDILYIYSYDEDADYSLTTTLTIDNEDLLTGTSSSLINDTDEILNLWNCITNDELCSIINLKKKIETNCNC